MDEEDFRAIVAVIQDELRAIGGEDMADAENYRMGDEEAIRPLSNQELAIAMLLSFERFLAMRDRKTYTRSMSEIIGLVTEGERPESAVVRLGQQMSDIRGIPSTLDLSNIPDLSEVRSSLRQLIGNLKEARRG